MKFRMVTETDNDKEITTFTINLRIAAKAIDELKKYGIENFDSCKFDFATGEIVAAAKSEYYFKEDI